jgi:hypothetical protein
METIASISSRKATATDTESETLKAIGIFCAAGQFVSLLLATYGVDLSPDFFGHPKATQRRSRFSSMGDQSEAGSIRFRGDAIDCIVREISETSAALELVSELYVPDAFTLAVPSEGLIRSCHVVWRVGRRIGVTFANASKP